jgi:hypothetical protein
VKGNLVRQWAENTQKRLSTLYHRVTKNGCEDNKTGFDNDGLLGPLNVGTICCPETSVNNYQPTS